MAELKDPNTKVKVFMSRASHMGYVFKNGTTVHFKNHRYVTESAEEIAELTKECTSNHPNYYIDPENHDMIIAQLDPNYELREQIRAEERAAAAKAYGDPLRDMGTTEQSVQLKGVANSNSIAGLRAHTAAQAQAAHSVAVSPVNASGMIISPPLPVATKL